MATHRSSQDELEIGLVHTTSVLGCLRSYLNPGSPPACPRRQLLTPIGYAAPASRSVRERGLVICRCRLAAGASRLLVLTRGRFASRGPALADPPLESGQPIADRSGGASRQFGQLGTLDGPGNQVRVRQPLGQ